MRRSLERVNLRTLDLRAPNSSASLRTRELLDAVDCINRLTGGVFGVARVDFVGETRLVAMVVSTCNVRLLCATMKILLLFVSHRLNEMKWGENCATSDRKSGDEVPAQKVSVQIANWDRGLM